MAIKKYNPTTPGSRNKTSINYRGKFSTKTPKKSLTKGVKRAVGRNNQGRITTRHKGGGNKKLYRDIDFKYLKRDIPAKITSIEYDPYRSAFIGLLTYKDGEKKYSLIPKSVKVGDEVIVSEKAPIKPGNRVPISKAPVGTFVYNVEIKPNGGARLARAAGNYIEVIAHDEGMTHIRMPSSEIRKVQSDAWASIGEVSNSEYRLQNRGKAGKNRYRGIRPTVRGSVMNTVDHPHGGGEGNQSIGLIHPKTPWGKPAMGVKTRKNKRTEKLIVKRRKKRR